MRKTRSIIFLLFCSILLGNSLKAISESFSIAPVAIVDITDLGGQILAQFNDSPSNEGINNLIDNSNSTKFLTFNASAYVQYQLNEAYLITSYTITSANDAPERDPKNWTLKASNDGFNWTTIDSRSNQDFASRYQTRTFSFTNVQSFLYYRLEMSNNSGSILQLAELELFGEKGGTPGDLVDITDITGNVSAQYSDSPLNEGISNLIDNSSSTKYLTFNASAWVQYSVTEAYVITKYTITSANDAAARDPKNWTLQGSNDGNSWTVLDSRSNEDFPSRFQTNTYEFSNNQAFTHFRLEMTNNSGSILQLAELELFGKKGTVVVEPPVADFTASTTEIFTGENIHYSNLSTDATSYEWTFNGGTPSSSTSENPGTITYNSEGTFTTTLRVNNSAGNHSKTITIIVNSIPVETVDITNDGGTATSNEASPPTNEDVTKVIDNNGTTKHVIFTSMGWIKYQAAQNYIVTKYAITSGNDAPARDPLTWTLDGSNDGINYTVLDNRTNEDFASRNQRREFTFTNSTKYRYYRLNITANNGVDEYGSDILQLSELEIFGVPQGGSFPVANFSANLTSIEPGETVTFTNLSSNATSYSWDFGDGQTSTSQNPSHTYYNEGIYSVTLVAYNGSESDTKVSTNLISVSTSTGGDWSSFIYPSVTVNNKAGNHQGVQLYTQLCQANGYNGIEDFVQACCLLMAKTIYYTVEEANAHGLRNITYELADGGALSWKGGSPPNITVGFDVNHIVTFVNQYGNEAAITEVLGVLCHELTHGYQKEPKNAGGYDGNSEFYGYIEGMADLGRLLTGGFNPERFPSCGGTWRLGYTTTAFFYQWLQNNKYSVPENFIRDLNLTAQNMSTWSHEAMCQQLFGRGIQSLWDEYQASVCGGIAPTTKSTSINGQNTSETIANKVEFTVAPNPFTNLIRITIPDFNKSAEVIIYNINGAKVHTETIFSAKADINTSHLPSGNYIISVTSGNDTKKLKIVK